ncbi:hypothetical protein QQM79_00845 [Marinobacteraceae bacterium S3BR75-40.1]
MYICINCKQGLMDPIRDEDEPEYTDRYQCGHCGHVSTIPSLLIITTQLLSALMGGGISAYLLLRHLGAAVSAWQFDQGTTVASHSGLVAVATLLIAGFAYTLYRAARNYYRRYQYLHPER